MNYYVDIRVLPNPDFSASILMNMLFSHLHKLLVEFRGEIGISFPNVDKTLGSLLRLHGDQSSLQQLISTPWTKGLKDYITISVVTPIPKNASYRVVRRFQPKSSKERLYRRSARKGWISEDEIPLKISNNKRTSLLPFLRIKSQSTGQTFFFFIEHGPILTSPVPGKFTAYGLSSSATIPWF